MNAQARIDDDREAPKHAFSARTAFVLIVVGIVTFAAYIVLSAFAPQLRDPSDGGTHALSKSAVGFAGAALLFRELGRPVVVRRGPASTDGAGESVMIVNPQIGGADAFADFIASSATTEAGSLLIVLPKWSTIPAEEQPDWVRAFGTFDTTTIEYAINDGLGPVGVAQISSEIAQALDLSAPDWFWDGATYRTGPIRNLQSIDGAGVEAVITDRAGRTVLGRLEDSNIYVLSEPDILNTQGLADVRTARAAEALVDAIAPEQAAVIFDVTLAGHSRSRNLVQLALSPPFLPAMLCIALAGALLGLNAAVRSVPATPAKRAFGFGKRALVENSAGLVALAGRDASLAPRFLSLMVRQFAAKVGAPSNLGDKDLLALLDRFAGGSVTPFSTLAGRANKVRKSDELVDFAREASRWRLEITRETD